MCPLLILQIVFIFLFQHLRNFFALTIRTLWPATPCVRSKQFFTKIEDRIFLEQYDEPLTSFDWRKKEQAAQYAK